MKSSFDEDIKEDELREHMGHAEDMADCLYILK